ncbi:MAG: ATP-binding cassette domain-containing protein, partial [Pyrobaculum sp.]
LVETASAVENVLFGSLDWRGFYIGIWRRDLKERALEALRVVGLEKLADVKVYRLSGGERQRVAIARALMQKSGLILADEPVASLDRETAESVLEILTSLNGVSVVAVMHDEDLARKFFQRGYLMTDGRLVRLW